MGDNDRSELNRREFLRKAAVTGAVAWAVPVIQSVAATPAFAQTACSPACFHSSSGGSPNCVNICQARCPAGTSGPGAACNAICNACPPCPTNDRCPPAYCNPSCFNCTGAAGQPCQCAFVC
jgi:hypothetical protein